jgi:mannose/cellobiose epimerase-like protein (N-acyl-D-glucosamine 2-epimerase family)
MAPHARWLENETDNLLAFGRASRLDSGGFGWLDARGDLDPAHPAELWITCRMTHVFALGALLGRPGCAPLADHGIAALNGVFADSENGGWFAAVAADGSVAAPGKEAYGHGFVILASASAAAAGRPGARELLDRALAVSEEHFWDQAAGMVTDAWDTAFAHAEPYRGVNSNMHTVEAYLAAADVAGAPLWRERALRIAERVVGEAKANQWRIPEHYDSDWRAILEYNAKAPADQFRPYGATVGHSFEWSRLILELRAALGQAAPDWMEPAARALFAQGVKDGWAADGEPGFVYTIDWEGRPVVRHRLHWVAAEAVGAAATLFKATGEAEYEAWYQQWWDYIEKYVADRQDGSWRHELDAANAPASTVWDGKPDTYHAVQATLIPRLPLAPAFAPALAAGRLDT